MKRTINCNIFKCTLEVEVNFSPNSPKLWVGVNVKQVKAPWCAKCIFSYHSIVGECGGSPGQLRDCIHVNGKQAAASQVARAQSPHPVPESTSAPHPPAGRQVCRTLPFKFGGIFLVKWVRSDLILMVGSLSYLTCSSFELAEQQHNHNFLWK